MEGKFTAFAKKARERYKYLGDIEMAQDNSTTITAPPRARKAPFLRDAEGNIYLWTEELALRGDLVAAYDPNEPDNFVSDQKQIQLNRELELARERADAEEVARLEAVKEKEKAEKAKAEAEEVAAANRRNLDLIQQQLEEERAKHATAMAEMTAKLDALAKQRGESVSVGEMGSEGENKDAVTPKPAKRARPKKKVKEAEQAEQTPEQVAEALDFDGVDD